MGLANLFDMLRDAKNDAHHISKQIEKLEAERAKIEAQPPHTEDLVRWALRRLDMARESFRERLRWSFNDRALVRWEPSRYETDAGPNILKIPAMRPGDDYLNPAPIGNFVDGEALLVFLDTPIRAALPKLIDEGFPAARKGLKAADRAKKLADIDAQIAKLSAQRGELQRALADAHAVVNNGAAKVGSDLDIAGSRERAEAMAALAAGEVMTIGGG